ncbi:MAG: hypothetical protein AB7I59_00810 [Geminicoccaceae bacterium]
MARGAHRIARRQPIARLGSFGLLVRALILLYLAALGAAAQAAVPVIQIGGGTLVLELCTAEGARTVVIDDAARTSDRRDADHHAIHDCSGCCAPCPPKALSARTSMALVLLAPSAESADGLDRAAPCEHATTRVPLPPRGPPTFS